ncbi:hypothetical protein [Geothrix edaphica]|uniref:Polysaccharide chain length determinant N-terminal domain-containing protein n=1 Tax=Geothrix edaphica TaxID=2927976 RepID=A0ABQ5PT89_9BACT|nr:hypothetical protein [Geothrix edaphica]GLH65664.1 hypothetical protein GETHED_00280 [Geothrix edaphica]
MPTPIEAPVLDLKASLKKPLQWAVAAGLLTAVVTLFMPNYYRSEARLLPVESKGLGGGLGGLATAAAAFGVSVPGGEGNDANFVDVLNSRWLREQLLNTEFQYHARSWRFGAEHLVKGTLSDYLEAKNLDRAVQELSSVLSVSRDLKSKVIFIGAETRSPDLSQLVVRRAGKLLEVFLQEKGHTRGGAKVVFAEARLAEARREMDEAEEALRRFLEGNRNYLNSADPAVRLKGTRLEGELRLRQQLVTTLALNREQALLEEKNDIPILNVLDQGNLPIEKNRPARSQLVVALAFLVGLGSWGFENRRWIKERLSERSVGSQGERA